MIVPARFSEMRGGEQSTPGSSQLHTEGQKFVDENGRTVILRGINVMNKSSPYLPEKMPNFERIKSWGMNSIRLGTFWTAIEPKKGQYDEEYLDNFAAIVEEATDAGLYVVVDFHQDVWGEKYGYKNLWTYTGAPEWASQEGLLPVDLFPHIPWSEYTGSWGLDYFSPQVAADFTNFWISDDLQKHYAGALKEVAKRVKDNPRVIGYDLMNEPHPGFIPPGIFETLYLYPSQEKWLEEIREVDSDAIGFLEPPILKTINLPTVPEPSPPPNSAYAPHQYGLWDFFQFPDENWAIKVRNELAERTFKYSTWESQQMEIPLWVGEFGFNPYAPRANEFIRSTYDMADEAHAGVAWWNYEPGTRNSPLNKDGTQKGHMFEIARIYPDAVPGLEEFHYEADNRTFTAEWSGDGTAVFAVPGILYPTDFTVLTDGTWTWNEKTAELKVTGGTYIKVHPQSKGRFKGENAKK